MKLPSGLLLLCLASLSLVRAEEAIPVKMEVAAVNRELVWPEIKDPQALIEFAKAEIKRVGEGDKKWGWPITLKPEFDYLLPGDCYVRPEYLVIMLNRHPRTGQALIILPDPSLLDEKTRNSTAKIEETKNPEIKRVLARTWDDLEGSIASMAEISVRWSTIKNLDKDKTSWPVPLTMGHPVYPRVMLRQGIAGEAKIEFTVAEDGLVSEIQVRATQADFESAVRDVARSWRFEPGVDRVTRLPAAARITLTVKFDLVDN